MTSHVFLSRRLAVREFGRIREIKSHDNEIALINVKGTEAFLPKSTHYWPNVTDKCLRALRLDIPIVLASFTSTIKASVFNDVYFDNVIYPILRVPSEKKMSPLELEHLIMKNLWLQEDNNRTALPYEAIKIEHQRVRLALQTQTASEREKTKETAKWLSENQDKLRKMGFKRFDCSKKLRRLLALRFGASFNENEKVTIIFDRVVNDTNFIDVFIPELGNIKARIGVHGPLESDAKIVTVNSGDPLWWEHELSALSGAGKIHNRPYDWWAQKYHEILASRFRSVLRDLKALNS